MLKTRANTFRVKVDNLGRVTIPIEIRRKLGIGELEFVEAACDGECVKFYKKDNTELDKIIRGILLEAKENKKVKDEDYKILERILGKLGR